MKEGRQMAGTERHESGTFSAFLTGALVGAGIALLLAPQSGEKLRVALRDYANRAKDGLDEALDSGAEAWESAKNRGEEIIEKGKESIRDAARHIQTAGETEKTGRS